MAAPRAGQRDPQALIGSSAPRERTPHRRSVDPRAFLRAREIQKRLATGEPVRYAVPVADPRLAVLPAQKHNLVVEQAGEIDQSGLRPIDQAPVRVNPLDQPLDLVEQAGGHGALLEVLAELRAAERQLGLAGRLFDLGADLTEGPEQFFHYGP